jgi:hypothetical protein
MADAGAATMGTRSVSGLRKMLFLIPAVDEIHAKVMLASTLDVRSRESGRNLCWGRGGDACL